MGLTFEWKTSTASHHMTKLFREKNIDYYYNKYGALVADIYGTGEYLKVDYKHLHDDIFEIIVIQPKRSSERPNKTATCSLMMASHKMKRRKAYDNNARIF